MSRGGEGNCKREIGKEEGRSHRVKVIIRIEEVEMTPEGDLTLKGKSTGDPEIFQEIGDHSQGVGIIGEKKKGEVI